MSFMYAALPLMAESVNMGGASGICKGNENLVYRKLETAERKTTRGSYRRR
jgi:hypothetical protein